VTDTALFAATAEERDKKVEKNFSLSSFLSVVKDFGCD
jgi:hypothetical protein